MEKDIIYWKDFIYETSLDNNDGKIVIEMMKVQELKELNENLIELINTLSQK